MSMISRVESPRRAKVKRRARRGGSRTAARLSRRVEFARDRVGPGVTDVSLSVAGSSIPRSSPATSPIHRTHKWLDVSVEPATAPFGDAKLDMVLGVADRDVPPRVRPPPLVVPQGLMSQQPSGGSDVSASMDSADYFAERCAYISAGAGAGAYAGSGAYAAGASVVSPRRRQQQQHSAASSPAQVSSWLAWHEQQLSQTETDPTGGSGWQIPTTASDVQQRSHVIIH